MIRRYFGLFLGLSMLAACVSNENKSLPSADSLTAKVADTPLVAVEFKNDSVAAIYMAYLQVKDALVKTNMAEAKQATTTLIPALKAYPGCENTAVTAEKIVNAQDIIQQRSAFTTLSSDIIALIKQSSLKNGTIYVQHCPMANKGDGGDWLSAEKKIQNPYYGSEMMECGAVIGEIK